MMWYYCAGKSQHESIREECWRFFVFVSKRNGIVFHEEWYWDGGECRYIYIYHQLSNDSEGVHLNTPRRIDDVMEDEYLTRLREYTKDVLSRHQDFSEDTKRLTTHAAQVVDDIKKQ